MGYDLHITRRESWTDKGNDITSEEWLDLVKNDIELQLKTENGPFFAKWSGKSTLFEPWLDWSNGQIQTKNPDDALIDKMVVIANELHAVVQGDDGEIYKSHRDAHRSQTKARSTLNHRSPFKVLGIVIFFGVCIFLFSHISREYLDSIISIFMGIAFATILTLIWIWVLFYPKKAGFAKKMKHYRSTGEILNADKMKQKYGLTIEKYKSIHLNPKKVPEQFRDLVQLAQKWGIGDDIIRADLHDRASSEEKDALKASLNGRTNAINQWLDSFGNKEMSGEAAAFMYMLLGLDEMGIKVDPGSDFHN